MSVQWTGLVLAPEMAGDSEWYQSSAPVEREKIVTGQLSITAGSRAVETVTVAGGRIDDRIESPHTGDSTGGLLSDAIRNAGALDSSVSQKNYLSDQVDLSTLTTSSTSEADGTPTNPGNFRNAMQGCVAALPKVSTSQRTRPHEFHGPVAPPYVAILYSVATRESCSSRIRRRTLSRCPTSMSSRSGTVCSPPSTSST